MIQTNSLVLAQRCAILAQFLMGYNALPRLIIDTLMYGHELDIKNGLLAVSGMLEELIQETFHPSVEDMGPVEQVRREMAGLALLRRAEKEEIWAQVGLEGELEEIIQVALRGLYAAFVPLSSGSYKGYSPLALDAREHIIADLELVWSNRLAPSIQRTPGELGAAYYFSRLLARESEYPPFKALTSTLSVVANKGLGKILFPRSFLKSLTVLDTLQPDFVWPTDIHDEQFVQVIGEWSRLLHTLYDRSELHTFASALFSGVVDSFSPFNLDAPRYPFGGLEGMVNHTTKPIKFGDIGCSTGGSTHSFWHKARKLGLPVDEIVTWDLEEELNPMLQTMLSEQGISLRHHAADFSQQPMSAGSTEGEFDLLCAYNSLVPHMSPYFVRAALKNALTMLSPDGGVFFMFGSWSHWQAEPGTVPSMQIRRIGENTYRLEFLAKRK